MLSVILQPKTSKLTDLSSRVKQTAKEFDQCCFTCAVKADNRQLFAEINRQIQITDGILLRALAAKDTFSNFSSKLSELGIVSPSSNLKSSG